VNSVVNAADTPAMMGDGKVVVVDLIVTMMGNPTQSLSNKPVVLASTNWLTCNSLTIVNSALTIDH
jgi:hypothetical protein